MSEVASEHNAELTEGSMEEPTSNLPQSGDTAVADVKETAVPLKSESGDPESYSDAKSRLDEIVKQVRAKDVSLERSLDLLEEGVKLANQCTELIDQTRWEGGSEEESEADEERAESADVVDNEGEGPEGDAKPSSDEAGEE